MRNCWGSVCGFYSTSFEHQYWFSVWLKFFLDKYFTIWFGKYPIGLVLKYSTVASRYKWTVQWLFALNKHNPQLYCSTNDTFNNDWFSICFSVMELREFTTVVIPRSSSVAWSLQKQVESWLWNCSVDAKRGQL